MSKYKGKEMTATHDLIRVLRLQASDDKASGNYKDAALMMEAAQRLRELDAVAKEYDELIRHMDAGGDFTEFIVSKRFKEST